MTRIFGFSKSKILSVFKLIPLLTVLMEILFVYPCLVWFGQWLKWTDLRPHMNFISYVILTVFTEVISGITQERGWSVKRVRMVVFPGVIVLWLVLFRWSVGGGYAIWDVGWFGYLNAHIFQMAIALLSGPYFIWRGISISRQSNLFEDLYRKFIIGLVFIILLLMAWSFSRLQSTSIWSTVGTYALSYFVVGLLTLALANLDSLSRVLARHQETVAAFRRRWSSMLVVIIIVILGIAVGVASIFYNNVSGILIHALSVFGEWVLIGITYLFWPFAFVATALYYIGAWIIALITHGKKPELASIKLPDVIKQIQGKEQQTSHLPPALITSLKWTAVGIIIGLAIFFIGRSLIRYWQSKTEEGVEEENESLWSWSTFKADLRNFLAWLFPWLRRRKKAMTETTSAQIAEQLEINSDKELTIRELYRALLRRGRLIGVPREKSETAYEYSGRLRGKREAAAEELKSLTEAYVIERYSDTPTGPEKTTFFNRLWRTLSSKLLGVGTESPK